MIPHDDFTPHGYLDNPYHSWKLNSSGVLRSLPPLGMGWHVPNLGSYVRNQFQYTAHLNIGLKIEKHVLVTPDDFRRQKCTINSRLHTKNRFEYTCFVPQYALTLAARYFLVHEHALGWGDMGFVLSPEDVPAWANGFHIATPSITHSEPGTGWQVRAVALPCMLALGGTFPSPVVLNAVLARGVSQDQAYMHWIDGIEEIARAEADHRADDEAFWQRAPQLSGDWPAHWRRGFVYDLETLRMTIRPPVERVQEGLRGGLKEGSAQEGSRMIE